MADVAIVNRATISAPKDYTLSANEELQLKAVRALVDGSGAATPFSPTLQLVAPDGTVMWESAPTGSIAAGGSADVSWFPGVGGGAGGGGIQALVGARIHATSAQTVPNSTETNLVYQAVDFDTDGMANLGSDNRILTINTPGLYFVVCQTNWVYNSAGNRRNGLVHNGFITGGANADGTAGEMAVWAPVGGDGLGSPHTANTSLGIFQCVAGDFFSSFGFQGSGGSLNCGGASAITKNDSFLSAVLVAS